MADRRRSRRRALGHDLQRASSLFSRPRKFPNYESLLQGTPLLTLLKEKADHDPQLSRRHPRIRNVLAHNKRVRRIRSRCSFYYESWSSHAGRHDQGPTKVNRISISTSRRKSSTVFRQLTDDIKV